MHNESLLKLVRCVIALSARLTVALGSRLLVVGGSVFGCPLGGRAVPSPGRRMSRLSEMEGPRRVKVSSASVAWRWRRSVQPTASGRPALMPLLNGSSAPSANLSRSGATPRSPYLRTS
jgi:hypothetical protein